MIQIIGAGLAGCEAAYQLAKRGCDVRLFEMKPTRFSPAHKLEGPAELVCSNSLGSESEGSAGALLKAEMRLVDSLILQAADKARVPAGSALAVDRQKFSDETGKILSRFDNIELVSKEISELPDRPTIIATGPLTSDALAKDIQKATGERLYFFDATSPIIDAETIDKSIVYCASRYDKGDPDYLNCPMTEKQYMEFVKALLSAQLVTPKDFENFSVFEGCMPIEQMAKRGEKTLAFGPLRPVGLIDPSTGRQPYAVVQLRKEDKHGASYNLVGFQTRMTFPEQKRVFRMIPGLQNADFLRLGVMHRNTYIDSPRVLDPHFRLKSHPHIQFAGQLTGVEGYMESTASGLLAALYCHNSDLPCPPAETMIGALAGYVTQYEGKNFQPMSTNFGLLPPFPHKIRKKERKLKYHSRGVDFMKEWIAQNGI